MTNEEYVAVAVGNAHEQGLLSADVQEMGYTEIAELAGVMLGADGSSPADFYYTQVRQGAVDILAAEEAAQLKADQKADLDAATRLFPSLRGLKVYELPEENAHKVK